MPPVPMKRRELEKSPCIRWSWTGGGHGTASHCPLSLEQYPHGSCHQHPASATAQAGKQRNGKNPPTALPQLSKGAPGKPLSQPCTAGDNGDKASGQAPCPQLGLCPPCPTRRALHSKGQLRDTEWLPPPRPQSTGHHTGTTWLCQHQNQHQTHQHSPGQTAVVSHRARSYPDNKDDG